MRQAIDACVCHTPSLPEVMRPSPRRITAPTCTLILPPALPLLFIKDFDLSSAHSLHEDGVVAFTLIGIGNGEVHDGLVEAVALAQVAADLGRFAGAGVGAGQGPATELGIL